MLRPNSWQENVLNPSTPKLNPPSTYFTLIVVITMRSVHSTWNIVQYCRISSFNTLLDKFEFSRNIEQIWFWLNRSDFKVIKFDQTESEFNEFEPSLKSAKNRFKLSAGLNLETLNTIWSGTNHIWASVWSLLNLTCNFSKK